MDDEMDGEIEGEIEGEMDGEIDSEIDSEMDSEIDGDQWLDQYERLSNISSNYTKEPPKSIEIFHVFINVNDYIEKIESEHFVFEHKHDDLSDVPHRIISREREIGRAHV